MDRWQVGQRACPDFVDTPDESEARAGAVLYCWSSGGAEYAERSAAELGLRDCFRAFLPKPHLLIDDVAPSDWRMVVLHPNVCVSKSVDELLLMRD